MNLAGYVDRHYLPGKFNGGYYEKYGDNEGLLSTIPAVATALLGVLAGQWLISKRGRWIKAAGLAACGLTCLGAGTLGSSYFPVIKILWTSTFVLVAGGWSLLLLALFYTIIDVIGLRAWAFFFVVIGVNAITIYVAARIIPFQTDIRVSPGRHCPPLRLSGAGYPGDRNCDDRMAVVAPSLPKSDILAGLSSRARS